MARSLRIFENIIIYVLIVMMMIVILLATIELGWIIISDILTPPIVLLEITELLDIFGFVLLVLIGIELLETIKAYLIEHVIHVEIVLEVALIAIARKVIILEPKEFAPVTLLSIAALIVTLAAAVYVEKRARHSAPFTANVDPAAPVEKTRTEENETTNP
jgi:uncharacterized membrane protein (DUF373 family)